MRAKGGLMLMLLPLASWLESSISSGEDDTADGLEDCRPDMLYLVVFCFAPSSRPQSHTVTSHIAMLGLCGNQRETPAPAFPRSRSGYTRERDMDDLALARQLDRELNGQPSHTEAEDEAFAQQLAAIDADADLAKRMQAGKGTGGRGAAATRGEG